jgi:hypothetical protein
MFTIPTYEVTIFIAIAVALVWYAKDKFLPR